MRPSKWTAGCVLLHDFLEHLDTLKDKSGYKNNGTVSGAIFSPPLGYFEFDGVDDNIVIQHNDLFNPHNDNFSIAFWFNTTISSTTSVICKSNGGAPSTNYGWLVSIASGEIRFFTATSSGSWGNNGTFEIKTSNTYNDGNWHSCVISVNRKANGRVKIYVDGKNVGATRYGNITTVGNIQNTLNVIIGSEADNEFYYKGYLKNVCYYSRKLTRIDAKNFDKGFIPLDGLVAIWKLDKTINGYTLDLPTRNYWGTVTGCTLHTTHEMLYNSRQFDGTDDYINCGSGSSLDITDEITIEAWVYFQGGGDWPRLSDKSPAPSIYFKSADGSIAWLGKIGGSMQDFRFEEGVVKAETNKWTHIVVTHNKDISGPKVYVGGEFKKAKEFIGELSTSTQDLYLGNRPSLDRTYKGYISEVIIYNRVLSDDEILAHSRNARFTPVR